MKETIATGTLVRFLSVSIFVVVVVVVFSFAIRFLPLTRFSFDHELSLQIDWCRIFSWCHGEWRMIQYYFTTTTTRIWEENAKDATFRAVFALAQHV
jgi:hypothetical protein